MKERQSRRELQQEDQEEPENFVFLSFCINSLRTNTSPDQKGGEKILTRNESKDMTVVVKIYQTLETLSTVEGCYVTLNVY